MFRLILLLRGYDCCIIMPDDVSAEKSLLLEKLGAKVEKVRPGEDPAVESRSLAESFIASIVDEKQVHKASWL